MVKFNLAWLNMKINKKYKCVWKGLTYIVIIILFWENINSENKRQCKVYSHINNYQFIIK